MGGCFGGAGAEAGAGTRGDGALVRSCPATAALIQRNCTEAGWSLPSPPYYNACELEDIRSGNDTEAKASGSHAGGVILVASSLSLVGIRACLHGCKRQRTHHLPAHGR